MRIYRPFSGIDIQPVSNGLILWYNHCTINFQVVKRNFSLHKTAYWRNGNPFHQYAVLSPLFLLLPEKMKLYYLYFNNTKDNCGT